MKFIQNKTYSEKLETGDLLLLGDGSFRYIIRYGCEYLAVSNEGVSVRCRKNLDELLKVYENDKDYGGVIKIIKAKKLIIMESE